MKKRTLFLLLAGLMIVSVLSGCGGKTGGQPDTPDRSDAGSAPVEDTRAPEESAPEESTAAPPARADDNPLFDQFAVQFHDVTIKPGMTLGEAVEAVQKSELPLVLSPNYPGADNFSEFDPKDLDQEFTVPEIVNVTMPDTIHEGEQLTVQIVRQKTLYVYYNGGYAFMIHYFDALPGEPGTTYRMRDLLVVGARVDSDTEYGAEIHTWLGTPADIMSMSESEIQAAFADTDAELSTHFREYDYLNPDTDQYEPTNVYYAEIFYPFSWNGYEILDGNEAFHSFMFTLDGKMVQWDITQLRVLEFWVAGE